MLTKKNLLNYKKSKGYILPKFISAKDTELLNFAAECINILANSIGLTKSELEAQIEELCATFDEIDVLLKNGLCKLLIDRLEFENLYSGDINNLRQEIFNTANQFLKETETFTLAEYLAQVTQKIKLPVVEAQALLYSDLPEHNKVTFFKSIDSKALLDRYNLALVQGLLFYSESVTLEISEKDCVKSDLRFLFRHLKFYQLVPFIQKENGKIKLQFDGPISLFLHTQKYGLNLAAFFPVIALLPNWQLQAKIEISNSIRQQGVLCLSQDSQLVSHYRNYSAYIPEEFKIFTEQFRVKSKCWVIDDENDEFLFDGGTYFFPDYKFLGSTKNVYLELFHTWHKKALVQRLSNLKITSTFNYMLGVAKVLLKDPEIAEALALSESFKNNGFIFREIPTVNQVIEVLHKFEKVL